MTNYDIAEYFSLLAKLTDIHGGDGFKAKSYGSAAFALENLPVQLAETDPGDWTSLKGIGASTAKKVQEILQTGKMAQLEELIAATPPGVIEMMAIKGLGPKKIQTVWKEMGIESVGELLYACKENRLRDFKGFGLKTQQGIIESIEFFLAHQSNYLYAQLIPAAEELTRFLQKTFGNQKIFLTGEFARQMETVSKLEFIIAESDEKIKKELAKVDWLTNLQGDGEIISAKTKNGLQIKLYAAPENPIERLIETSSSSEFFTEILKRRSAETAKDEAAFFSACKTCHIPAFLRENPAVLDRDISKFTHLQHTDIKGLIHCHSNWSDGDHTIRELAEECISLRMEYMVISDHSKTAAYAKGLTEDRVAAQHKEVDDLNGKLAPFRIFKSIESDILGNGDLDYSDAVLSSFDLVIASVHSNLKMTQEKAMERLLRAIENPYTTILGHMTGRLLLSRPGYPVDYKKLIDACAANDVVIELNANPRRLDMDWREITYALEKGVLISIDPDAHSKKGIQDIKYGVLSAQKALLSKENNLSSFGLHEFEEFLFERRQSKGI